MTPTQGTSRMQTSSKGGKVERTPRCEHDDQPSALPACLVMAQMRARLALDRRLNPRRPRRKFAAPGPVGRRVGRPNAGRSEADATRKAPTRAVETAPWSGAQLRAGCRRGLVIARRPAAAEGLEPSAGDRRRLDPRAGRFAAFGDHRPAHRHLCLHLADHARRSARQRDGQLPRSASTSRARRSRSGSHRGLGPIRPRPRPERAGEREAREQHPPLDQPYRIDIQVKPTVPILNISAQGPNKDRGGAPGQRRDWAARLPRRAGRLAQGTIRRSRPPRAARPGARRRDQNGHWPADRPALLHLRLRPLVLRPALPRRRAPRVLLRRTGCQPSGSVDTSIPLGDYCLIRELGRGGMGVV